ncbi:NAD(P)-dependent oxidoreductase [Salisediminibacterium halotolerans]|uniref:NAD(P)-dependent oxidoreductase n=1 Tax=Salisediminibacterium halotolerans TaxID=517425 RepID=UPI000EAE713A|nr:NAD(P)-dependent oxidoreductase [Salisediminibacterium halotolerans]RLJ69658.1 3-hydroxyisobutyrate dehydrogenase [Actinophytocola xinjiangensis]RPE89716.1 3-hydroxyisobutyrate dehydrogenase [Salisediminibacterium halotolerans]TWG32552.1 3-hydroxyisobutyrate dehydrogenase [Salisediminibacterium halotolerans]GEL08443.1 putative oxidoreductase YkwC [Salisediminibacterium halotolerans]
MSEMTIGFIGTGVMGKSMAKHIMNNGYSLVVYNRTKEKAEELIDAGAHWASTPKEAAEKSDIIMTIVGFPADVEALYFGSDGIIANAKKGSILVDMTTSKPALAEKIALQAGEKGVYALDAPVSGGDVGAREAKLAIMAGGEAAAFETVYPVFSAIGGTIERLGPAGAGQHTKMANQIAIASTMMGTAEALAYTKRAGLSQDEVLSVIETGAAGSFSLSQLGRRMIKGDYAPGFYIKHFIKDMAIAIESAEELGMDTPGLNQAKKLYDQLAERGFENSGTQAIYTYYTDET